MAAWDVKPVGLTADGQTDRLMATVVSGNYFSTLRLDPAAGRLILPSDGELGGTEPIVVLSHSYWTRRFGGSASIVGREVRIDGRPFTVVGVAPEKFHGTFTLLSSDAYLPLELFQSDARLSNRDVLSVRVIARLKPQMALDHARASTDTVARRLEQDHPATNAGRRVRAYAERLARPEPQNESQGVALAALFLMLVGAILLIACANVLGLFLARGLGRGREMAIRAALGASRWDLVRLCLVEALVIGLLGAAAGAAAGVAAARALATMAASPGFPLFLEFRARLGNAGVPGRPAGRQHAADWISAGAPGVARGPAERSVGKPDLDRRRAAAADSQGARRDPDGGVRGAAGCVRVVHSKSAGPAIGRSRLRRRACSAGLDGSRRGGLRRRQSAFVLRVARRGIGSTARRGIGGRLGLRSIRHQQFDAIRGRRRSAAAIEHHRHPGGQTLRQRRLLSDDRNARAARPYLHHRRRARVARGGGRERSAGGASLARRRSSRETVSRELGA